MKQSIPIERGYFTRYRLFIMNSNERDTELPTCKNRHLLWLAYRAQNRVIELNEIFNFLKMKGIITNSANNRRFVRYTLL